MLFNLSFMRVLHLRCLVTESEQSYLSFLLAMGRVDCSSWPSRHAWFQRLIASFSPSKRARLHVLCQAHLAWSFYSRLNKRARFHGFNQGRLTASLISGLNLLLASRFQAEQTCSVPWIQSSETNCIAHQRNQSHRFLLPRLSARARFLGFDQGRLTASLISGLNLLLASRFQAEQTCSVPWIQSSETSCIAHQRN
jgi:hypothetical protein